MKDSEKFLWTFWVLVLSVMSQFVPLMYEVTGYPDSTPERWFWIEKIALAVYLGIWGLALGARLMYLRGVRNGQRQKGAR